MKFKPRERWTLGGIGALTYGSGAVLFVFARAVRVATPVGEQHHAAEQWVRILHSGAAYALVFGAGYLLKGHVFPGLRARTPRRVKSGIANLLLFGALVGTALAALYAGDTPWLSQAALIHGVLGVVAPAFLIAHGVRRLHAARGRGRTERPPARTSAHPSAPAPRVRLRLVSGGGGPLQTQSTLPPSQREADS